MKKRLIESLKRRLATEVAPQNPVSFLKQLEVENVIDTIIAVVYLYTRPKKGLNKQSIYLAEIISAIGHAVRNKAKLKRSSGVAAKAGAFILYSFEENGMLQVMLGQGAKGHNSYVVQVLNDEAICTLWSAIDNSSIEKLPSETPYAPWTSSKHPTGMSLIKTRSREVLEKLTPETHPMVFACVNKAQEIGWRVNKTVYDLHLWALRNKTDAFADIWELQNPEAKTTKIREARAIGDIAKRFLNKTFYHIYSFDFRGRKYPATAYLHEQGSDLARGLLLRADSKVIGKQGFFWLTVSIASNWAGSSGREDGAKTDKIPLLDRHRWVLDNEEILLSYAEKPKVNQGWMKADKPWQFLAACAELKRFRTWQQSFFDETIAVELVESELEKLDVDPYDFESSLECYIDGSNNGSQHLSALTRDEVTAPHVNLVPLDLPGDLYKYVGDHVWESLQKRVDAMPKEEVAACNKFIDSLMKLKRQIHEALPKSEERKELIEQAKKFKEDFKDTASKASPVYWLRLTDSKHKRKVVKR